MASSSTSRTWKYDVFPSFSGEDVRKTFLSHLLEKLRSKLIVTFIDHGIERSHPIAPELLSAIKGSMISIIVFSKKYASSTWCLNELVEIHKCYNELDQMVIPVFYDVDPSDVRKQTGDFGNNFKETCKRTTEDVKQKWMEALKEVASIAGEDFQNWKNEANLIEQISKDVSDKLFTQSEDFGDFVGMDAHIEAMNSMLCLENEEVRMVGIVGPSGIGKSTIARALFSRLSNRFNNRVFVSYKRTIHDDYGMQLAWEKQFLSDILDQKDIKLNRLGVVERRIKNKKVLIVVDDVDDLKLLETVVGKRGWFGCGSRIIVVTQDRHILKSHEIELIYEVGFPSKDLALEMLCRSAFGQNSPPDGFMELAVAVAELAGNLPLGMNVLGSSLRRRDKEEWVKMLPRLQDGLDGKIEKILKISYDALDRKDQDLFIHIACFLSGKRVISIEDLLKGTANTGGLIILAEKSLIRITSPYKTVEMHNMLRALGREIVRAESFYNPGKRRFLVNAKDITDVFENNTGSDRVLGIICTTSEFSEPLSMDKKSFKRMRNLQFLKFYNEWRVQKTDEVRIYLPQGLVYLPRKLRLLHWDEYPAKYIPSNFIGDYLVEFTMQYSKLEKMWEGTQPLRSLKKIDMRFSKDLKEIPDLSNAKNLNILDLDGCKSLVTLPSSIRNLDKLKSLLMYGCRNLKVLPTDVNLESLESLILGKTSRLRCFPRISRNISRLYLDGTAMEEEDCLWIENLSGITDLYWENCPLRCMPSNFHPEHLVQLSMANSKLEKLWTGVQSLESLVYMFLSQSENLKELPDLSKAINLKQMNLSGCENLKEIPDLSNATSLLELDLSFCVNLNEIPDLSKATSLAKLNLWGCKSLKEIPNLSKATSLVELDLSGCENLKEIPDLSKATSLVKLNLWGCKSLKEIPDLSKATSLVELDLPGCENLEEISDLSKATSLVTLNLLGCKSLKEIPDLSKATSLVELDLSGCENLKELPDLSISLETLSLSYCKSLVTLPSSFRNLYKLESLYMRACTGLVALPTDINLVSLTYLDLSGCSLLTTFPHISTSLEELHLNNTAIEEVPSWIENIAGLEILSMRSCKKLTKTSATIWNLKQLKSVDFTGSSGLTSITDASLVKTISGLHPERVEYHPINVFRFGDFFNLDRDFLYAAMPVMSITGASLVKTIAESRPEGVEYYPITKFHFVECFNLDRDAQELILKSDFLYAAMPGEEVPTYFTHRTCGSSLTVPLSQSFLSHSFLRFKACIILECDYILPHIIIHWKFRGVKDKLQSWVIINSLMDHQVVFDFYICNREEVHGPLSQLDCNNVEFEFEFDNKESTANRIKGCGIRILDISPSMDISSGTEYNQHDGDNNAESERSSDAEYNHQSGENDAESERSKKRMKMTVVTSQKPPNLPVAGTGIPDLNLKLSLCLGGASSNIHGDGTIMHLEEEDLYVDPMITEQQGTGRLIEDHLSSPQLINFFR